MASLLSNAPPSTAPIFKCNTCFAAFPSMDMLREHYKSPWHVFNSKRRAHNLPHVGRDQFLGLQKAALKTVQLPAPTMPVHAPVTQKIPTRPTNGKVNVAAPQAKAAADENVPEKEEAEGEEGNDEETVFEDVEDEAEEEDAEDEEEDVDLSPEISLFDNKRFDSVDECLQYMSSKYGFFIPDFEFLEDLPGLLEYLSEKVRLGNICLYCQKRFRNMTAVQRHMVDKSHCKIAYEEGVDMDDVSDFYDFTATYEDRDDVEVDEDGNVVDEELETAPTGELILPDGRILGHRSFRRYYKQYYRQVAPNEAVLAAQREELLRLTGKFGSDVLHITNAPAAEVVADGRASTMAQVISSLPDIDVMDRLIKYQKLVRKNNIIEQKGQMRAENLAKRREYKNNIAKVRSSETTTAKIRDYHGILK